MKVIGKGVTELRDVTVTHVSYVRRGANKKTFVLHKSDCESDGEVEFEVNVLTKGDLDDKHLLYGVVYAPDEVDSQGDTMNAEEIEKTAHEFMTHYRNIDKEHNLIAGVGTVVENYIAPVDFEINNNIVKAGSWVLVTKASDEIWNEYMNGDITGYSMYGIVRRSIKKSEPQTTWIQKAFEKLGLMKSFSETLNDVVNDLKTSPSFLIDIMIDDFWKNIDWSETDAERLSKLSKSMTEAALYIDEIIGSGQITKSNDEPIVENNNTEETMEDQNTPEVAEVTPDVAEPVVETEEVVEKSSEIGLEALQGVISLLEEIKKSQAELKLENEELKNTIAKQEDAIEKIMTKSNFVTTIDNKIIENEIKPQLF